MQQQEELTGFDVQGHCVSAVCVGGLAESSDVRGDLDKGRILNTFLAQCLDFGVEDLAQKRTDKDREKFPFLRHSSDLKS